MGRNADRELRHAISNTLGSHSHAPQALVGQESVGANTLDEEHFRI